MKTKIPLRELEEALEVVLDETLKAARDFESQVKRLQSSKRSGSSPEGRYGELAAAAFLLKLKAEAAHETLEQLIEAEPDE
ncbi:MAG: hypothetical protein NZ610_05610 [Candidatus Bipolaricaulota bacterium]|nr:hypothetical protein [Candidatus Bipolaricaulota bacterium]MDW8110217.1 hypothetical protein [Candidatus Bipolaricaulota bacterium]MDW8328883.1 hypothetical protein [Candidatus Bipolaricaulota bacterium]